MLRTIAGAMRENLFGSYLREAAINCDPKRKKSARRETQFNAWKENNARPFISLFLSSLSIPKWIRRFLSVIDLCLGEGERSGLSSHGRSRVFSVWMMNAIDRPP